MSIYCIIFVQYQFINQVLCLLKTLPTNQIKYVYNHYQAEGKESI